VNSVTITEERPDLAPALQLLAELDDDLWRHQYAIGWYERHGFQRRPPFGEYKPDPLSVYFEKALAAENPH